MPEIAARLMEGEYNLSSMPPNPVVSAVFALELSVNPTVLGLLRLGDYFVAFAISP